MQQMQKMGPMGQLMGMIPGMGGMAKEAQDAVDRGDLKRVEAIILSMTPRERREPGVLNASRRRRIANGSGTSLPEVNRLVKQFGEMQKLMKQLSGGRRTPRRHGPAARTSLRGTHAHDRPGPDAALRRAAAPRGHPARAARTARGCRPTAARACGERPGHARAGRARLPDVRGTRGRAGARRDGPGRQGEAPRPEPRPLAPRRRPHARRRGHRRRRDPAC